jgi:hypothetical protein
MSESEEQDWLAELAAQLFENGERIARDTRRGKMSGIGPVPPFQQRLVRAADVAMRELAPTAALTVTPVFGATAPVAHRRTAALTVRPVFGATATVTGSFELALRPMRFSGQATVKDRPRGIAALSDGEKAAFVLVWLYAVWLPWFASRLPPELHQLLSDSITNYALALAISWRMFDKHK